MIISGREGVILNCDKDKIVTDIISSWKDRIPTEGAAPEENKIDLRLSKLRSLIPPRYREVGPADSALINANCSILWGGFGTGKTYSSYALGKELFLKGEIKEFRLITEIGLINDIKAGFSDGSFDSRVNRLKQIDLLIIDEVGKSNETEFNKAQLFEILNHRYNWMKRTVLICNAEQKEELFGIIPTAILDRFRENVIHMDGKSRRYRA